MGSKYTHWCVTEKGDIYVLDCKDGSREQGRGYEQVFAPLEHILYEHPEVPELSMRAVRLLGFSL
jgi:hypothetical protein